MRLFCPCFRFRFRFRFLLCVFFWSVRRTYYSFPFLSFCAPVVAFIKRMIDPEVGAGAVDVYAPMFACQFIIFLIILFSWSAFSSPEVRYLI